MDLIDRQAAIDAIKTIRREIWGVDIPSPGDCPEYVEHHEQMKNLMHTCDNLIKEIEKQNTAERTGTWLVAKGACKPEYMQCSKCGWIFEYYGGLEEEWNYCPHCGARMERE